MKNIGWTISLVFHLPNPFWEFRFRAMERAIPIENFYYLLCYAFDQLPDRESTRIDSEACPDSLNLLAIALTRSIQNLAKKGLERQYLERTEETPRLQGKVLVHESKRRMIDRQARMLCVFDELSVNCLSNQILRSTCDLLVRARGLTTAVRKEVRSVRQILRSVDPIKVTESICARVRIHRNNRRYRMPLNICKLILRAHSPNERHGNNEFFDPLMEEKTMAGVFESFVRNFARIHLPQYKVGARRIEWQSSCIHFRILNEVEVDDLLKECCPMIRHRLLLGFLCQWVLPFLIIFFWINAIEIALPFFLFHLVKSR
ncbi:hypothetical protein OAK16_05890 [Verrucomicrobia bacterium]|nr:hypothetical protein [Verrucomicrobiota bacterium]